MADQHGRRVRFIDVFPETARLDEVAGFKVPPGRTASRIFLADEQALQRWLEGQRGRLRP